jgi:hypothetical protein
MRRTLLAPLFSAGLLIGLMLPSAVLGAETAGAQPATEVVPAPVDEATIRLGCALVRTHHTGPAVKCHWSAVEADDLRGYKLWRARDVPGHGPRVLIAKVAAGERLRHLDRHVRRGHFYTYAVVAKATDGSTLAISPAVSVWIPARHDHLRMACGLATAHGENRGVACKWSGAKHPAAAGYVLWRKVDGGPRERIYRTGLDGRRSFLDTDVERGEKIRYGVSVVTEKGRHVGKGGPVVVWIPARHGG